MSEVVDILLVDDKARNLDALEAILADPGYRLLRALDADAALKLLLEHDVAAIVLDIKMPGTTGFELAQMIKATKRYRQIPILFLTAYLLEDQDVIAGYGAGAVDYLTKPLNPQIVRYKVAVFADLFRKTRALALLNEKLEERVGERTADLEKSETALRAADHHKNEFIAILAHELRNPLVPLRFGLDILAGQQASPMVADTIGRMNRQLDHMVRLIDDLLDVSRISRGAIELKKEAIDLGTVIQSAVDITRPFIDRRQQQLSLEVAAGFATYGDPTRLAQILGILLHNATKFTPEGGRISVQLAREGDLAVIRVIDSGTGIAPEMLERTFEMFARVGDAAPGGERGGLGIGLALGRRLAEMHGGTLTAASDGLGCGATFILGLPMVAAPEAAAARSAGETKTMAPLDIVVIEDCEDSAEMLAIVLESMGHRVSVARDGLAGLALVEQQRPQVVVCDLGLPDVGGVEVCRRVRALPLSRQPLMVALTGWGREDDHRRTSEAQFDDHLVKPVKLEKLRAVLGKVAG